MKIDKFKITYSTTIPIQSYGVNDKIGVEVELSEGDIASAIPELKKQVDEIVAKLYPNRYGDGELSSRFIEAMSDVAHQSQRSHLPPPEERRIGDIVADIKSCTDLRILETYRIIAKTKPEFKEAYDTKYAELSNKSQ